MLSVWTNHLRNNPEEKQKFEEYVKNSKLLINRLNDILTEFEKSVDRSEKTLDQFDDPNWAYRQAFMNGYKGCLSKLKTAISIDQEEK